MANDLTSILQRRSELRAALEAAEAELEQAVRDAVEAGVPIARLARQVGVSRPTLYKMLGDVRKPSFDRVAAEARLADIDARYLKLVEALEGTIGDARDCKADTAKRNVRRGKMARRAGGEAARMKYPTVKDDLRRAAETKLLGLLAERADDPVFQAVSRELDEAETLRALLHPIPF